MSNITYMIRSKTYQYDSKGWLSLQAKFPTSNKLIIIHYRIRRSYLSFFPILISIILPAQEKVDSISEFEFCLWP